MLVEDTCTTIHHNLYRLINQLSIFRRIKITPLAGFKARASQEEHGPGCSSFCCGKDVVLAVKSCYCVFSACRNSNLVDSASSHTLVSKIKPCMSKYKQLYTVKLRMAHYISYSLFDGPCYLDNRSNSRANTCIKAFGLYLLD